jgi:hypothetical protein
MHGSQIIPVVTGVFGEPQIIHDSLFAGSLQKILQYYNSQYKYITSELKSESIIDHKFTNHLFKSYKSYVLTSPAK